jgi:hypothetical protein
VACPRYQQQHGTSVPLQSLAAALHSLPLPSPGTRVDIYIGSMFTIRYEMLSRKHSVSATTATTYHYHCRRPQRLSATLAASRWISMR